MEYKQAKDELLEAKQDSEALIVTIEQRMNDLQEVKREINATIDDITGYFKGFKEEQFKIIKLKEELLRLEALNK